MRRHVLFKVRAQNMVLPLRPRVRVHRPSSKRLIAYLSAGAQIRIFKVFSPPWLYFLPSHLSCQPSAMGLTVSFSLCRVQLGWLIRFKMMCRRTKTVLTVTERWLESRYNTFHQLNLFPARAHTGHQRSLREGPLHTRMLRHYEISSLLHLGLCCIIGWYEG